MMYAPLKTGMKIFFHINSLGRGGAERVVSILVNEFILLGHEVVVATEWEDKDEYALPPKAIRIGVGLDSREENYCRIKKIFLRYMKVRQSIISYKPDVVISFCNKANFRCSLALLFSKIPLIVSVRNDPKLDYLPYKLSKKIMEKRADGCVFQTREAASCFSNALVDRSEIIINPLSLEYIKEADFKYNAEDKIHDSELNIVSVGRISKQKNQLLLIDAFNKIKDDIPKAKLRIYGGVQDEAVKRDIVSKISEYGIEDRVYLMGLSDNIGQELRKAYLFVLPSLYEGMPNALLEAMSMGIPAISTNCPAKGSELLMQMVCEDKELLSLMLVENDNSYALSEAMKRLLANKNEAQRVSDLQIKIKEQAHPEAVAKKWIDYIEKTVKR